MVATRANQNRTNGRCLRIVCDSSGWREEVNLLFIMIDLAGYYLEDVFIPFFRMADINRLCKLQSEFKDTERIKFSPAFLRHLLYHNYSYE